MTRLIAVLLLSIFALTAITGCHASADAGHGGAGAGISVGD